LKERPHEPDPDNSGVGNGKIEIESKSSIPFRDRGFFVFRKTDEHMKLKVNGEDKDTQSETILQLLKELDIVPERVAVEVNLRIIKRVDFENFKLYDGDVVEIVYFVGGGIYGGQISN
jgi:thiamine biosynthesis protein ThiS